MKNDRELFKDALKNAFAEKYGEELEKNAESADCSEEHMRRMSRILGFRVGKRENRLSRKTKIIITILAAAMVLSGCSTLVYRERISTYVERSSINSIILSHRSEADRPYISEAYEITFVPAGYELEYEHIDRSGVYYEWKNGIGSTVCFTQSKPNTAYTFKGNKNDITTIEHNNYTIYRIKNNSNTRSYNYIWTDGKYSLSLSSDLPIKNSRLFKIIDSIVVSDREIPEI